MIELGISFDELNCPIEERKRIMSDLLCRIGADDFFDLSRKKIVIDIFPAAENGCTIFITAVKAPTVTHKRKIKPKPQVWEFSTAEDMLASIDELKRINSKTKCSLYLFRNRYRLILAYSADRIHSVVLSEFGTNLGGYFDALYTTEHGTLLSDNPIQDIACHSV